VFADLAERESDAMLCKHAAAGRSRCSEQRLAAQGRPC
jgi:hypothetical protein